MRPPTTIPEPAEGAAVAASVRRWAVSVGTRREWSGGRRGRKEFTTSVHESLFERGIFKPIERATSDEENVGAGRYQGLVGAIEFPEAAFGAGAGDGVTHGRPGGDHAEAGWD